MRIVSVLLFLFPVLLTGQDNFQYAAVLIPPDLIKNANAVIRQQDVEFSVKSAGEATLRERRIVTLFNDKSHFDFLVLHYNSFNKLGKIKGKVYNSMGQFVREIGKSEIRDESAISSFSIYEDSRVRYVDVDYSEFPYTVEFEYEMTWKDLLDYPNWQLGEFGAAVQNASFTLDLPEGFGVQFKTVNMDVKPTETTVKGRHYLKWAMENLPAVKREPYGPPAAELLPMLLVSPNIFEAQQYTGSMASWKDFGHFISQLMKGRDELSPAMKETVRQLTAGAATEQEKIEVLYRYLQQNMRYVSVQLGIGGWQPFDAKYVEANKYGDCKALSNFMKAMLKEAGIGSNPVLIYAGDLKYEVTEDFATPMFNHVILHVPSQDYWLECTSNTSPPNYLSDWTAGRNVVLVTEQGGVLARTPELPAAANFESNEVSIKLQADGQAALEVNSVRRGSKQDWYRQAVVELSQEDLRKKYQENLRLPGFTFENLSIQPTAGKPEASINFKATIPRYASKAGKRLFIPFNAFNPFTEVPPANENRLHPVVMRDGYTEEDKITITLPADYNVESLPGEDFILESAFGKYSLKTSQSDGVITIERHLEILPVRLPAEEYNAWRDFYKEIARMDGAKVVLVERKT
jgi:transglutaminase-like putative cysteine protease